MIPAGILNGSSTPVFDYVSNTNNVQLASGVNTYTKNGQSINTASSDRIVIVSTSFASGAFTQSAKVSGVTCNGNAMTPIRTPSSRPADTNLWYLLVTTGTTADFVVTLESISGDERGGIVGFSTLTGYSSSSPTIVDADASANENYTLQVGDTLVSVATGRTDSGSYIFGVSSMDIDVIYNSSTDIIDSVYRCAGLLAAEVITTAGTHRVEPSSILSVATHESFVYAVWR